MNIEYLYSIIDLYLKNENDNSKICLNIRKIDNNIEFKFTMRRDNPDKTVVMLPLEQVNNYWYDFLNKYKSNLLIIDEKYKYKKENDTCHYDVLFVNGRTISFDGFSIIEINGLRNCLYTIRIDSEEIRVNLDEEKDPKYKPQLNMQVAGFSSFKTLFFVTLFILDIFMVSLWICKLLMK